MTESTNSDAKMAGLLREELEALERQRDQYALAMDTATDPKVSIRLARTLERIEDEIEGLEESLRALPDPEPPAEPEPESTDGDWDDEPSTSIYSPEAVREQLAALQAIEAAERDDASTTAMPKSASMDDSDLPGEEPKDPAPTEPEPEASVEDDDVAFASAPEGLAPAEVPAEPEPASAREAAPEPEPAPAPAEPAAPEVRATTPEGGNPLGPVWMDGLSPPTGKVPNHKVEAAAAAPAPVSPDVLGDDPFALPGQQAAPRADTDPSSPFGTATGAGPGVSDFANPVSVLDDEYEENSWGSGGKVALALAVGAFLAGAFYIMSIG